MSMSSGWLIANATTVRTTPAGIASSPYIFSRFALRPARSLFGSSVATAPGEITVVRMLYGFTSCRSPSDSARTACLVAA